MLMAITTATTKKKQHQQQQVVVKAHYYYIVISYRASLHSKRASEREETFLATRKLLKHVD
jgi:hypothetical protein